MFVQPSEKRLNVSSGEVATVLKEKDVCFKVGKTDEFSGKDFFLRIKPSASPPKIGSAVYSRDYGKNVRNSLAKFVVSPFKNVGKLIGILQGNGEKVNRVRFVFPVESKPIEGSLRFYRFQDQAFNLCERAYQHRRPASRKKNDGGSVFQLLLFQRTHSFR